MISNRRAAPLLAVIALLVGDSFAEEAITAPATTAEPHGIQLSSKLADLLREEMRAISGGVQSIAPRLATGDWKAVEDEARKIQASYILEKNLSHEEKEQLEHSLPKRFRDLDAAFHERAGALAISAEQRNFALALRHYSRLLESCVGCHSEFAAARFPALSPRASANHHK